MEDDGFVRLKAGALLGLDGGGEKQGIGQLEEVLLHVLGMSRQADGGHSRCGNLVIKSVSSEYQAEREQL